MPRKSRRRTCIVLNSLHGEAQLTDIDISGCNTRKINNRQNKLYYMCVLCNIDHIAYHVMYRIHCTQTIYHMYNKNVGLFWYLANLQRFNSIRIPREGARITKCMSSFYLWMFAVLFQLLFLVWAFEILLFKAQSRHGCGIRHRRGEAVCL